LWSHDLKGDGREELVFVSDGKVQAVSLAKRDGKASVGRIWEWPLPDKAGKILGIHPAHKPYPAIVVVQGTNTVYGLDGTTGRLRWRCDGPGLPAAIIPADNPRDLPGIIFHLDKPENTVCHRLLPVDPGGKYLPPTPSAADFGPPEE